MLSKLKVNGVKVINKLLAVKGRVVLTRPGNKKKALVSYVLVPPYFIPFYYKTSHNNAITSFLIAKALLRKGYDVYCYNYLDERSVNYDESYDVFIGHNITFTPIASRLKGNFKKILLATGSDPHFGNQQQNLRIADVNRRKGSSLAVYNDNIVPDLSPNYELADEVLLLGNSFVRNTYAKRFQPKIKLINNVTLHPYFRRGGRGRKNCFLFISSVGQVHRGLDLLLDVFSSLPYELLILSAFELESEFVALYERELFHTPNIKALGFLPLDSAAFRDAVNDADFVILPSCAEGQSSSVINLMAYSVVPVIPENAGIPDVEKIGVLIGELTIDGVRRAVESAVRLTSEEYERKQTQVVAANKLFMPQAFVESVMNHLP